MNGTGMSVCGRWAVAIVIALGASACSTEDDAAPSGAASDPSISRPAVTSTAAPGPNQPTEESATSGPDESFPGAEWSTIDPAAAGFDVGALDEITAAAATAGSNCFLVARDGRIVTEQYWNGTGPDSTQEVFSASKSVTSTLAGIAHGDGVLDVDDLASEYIPEWADTPSATVTVEQLLSNDSGREHDARTDYVEMAGRAADKTAFSIGLTQLDPPGTVWAYNNAAIQTLEAVISTATGTDLAEYAETRLFEPIGMSDSSIRRDAAGNPLAFMGVQSNCRDLARFATLMLHEGEWDGTQIVDADWVHDATGQPSQDLNSAYGWLWWLNRPGTVLGAGQATGDADAEPTMTQLAPGAPEDMYWALGFANQVVAIDPGSGTVVVRLGPVNTAEGTPKFDAAASSRVVTEALVRG